MPQTRIKLFATLQLKLGLRSLLYDGPPLTVSELIDWMQLRTGGAEQLVNVRRELLDQDDRIRSGTMILVDGKNIHHLQGIETPTADATVSLFPPAGGG